MVPDSLMGVQKHKRTGNRYRVLAVANEHASEDRKEQYPVTVVYMGTDKKVWSRPLANFLDNFEGV